MEKEKIYVERDTYIGKDEKEHFSYFVKGELRGKDVRVRIPPPDVAGYTVLEIVFGDKNKAELTVAPFEIKDDKGKVTASGNTYGVKFADEDGMVYESKIKPFQESDRALLGMLLKKAAMAGMR